MAKIRNLDEVRDDVAAIEAEIEQLKQKAESEEGLTPEEAARLEELVAQLEALKTEEQVASAEARYQKVKAKADTVQRTLPQYKPAKKVSEEFKLGSGIGHWFHNERSPEAVEKIRSAGLDPNSKFASIPFDARRINFKKRTVLSTGGSASGAEWASYKTYSDKVFEYLTYENPVLGFVNTEAVNDGQEKYYFDIDDTSMKSVKTSSGGSETSPNIPESNVASGRKEIKCFTLTSGYQKVSLEMLQDSPFSLEEKIAAASTKAHARALDELIVTGSGNGVTDFEGIVTLATGLPDVSEWSIEALEELWDAVPDYYRDGAIFLSDAATKAAVRRALKDTTGRTFFDRVDVGDLKFDALFGSTWVVSPYMTADTVVFFNPKHYTMPVVNQNIFQRFDEKFFGHTAWAGIIRAGGANTGATAAYAKLTLDAGS